MHQPLTTTNIALYKICVSHLLQCWATRTPISYLLKYLTIALTIRFSSGITRKYLRTQSNTMTSKAMLTDSTIISPQSNSKLIIQLPLHSRSFADDKEQ